MLVKVSLNVLSFGQDLTISCFKFANESCASPLSFRPEKEAGAGLS